MNCRICDSGTVLLGEKWGKFRERFFRVRHCEACRFTFVEDPWLDFDQIYNTEYYEGRGADPLVDYINELDHPDRTVRKFEWRGLLDALRQISPIARDTRWLDYGCGNGSVVRYAREHTPAQVFGYDTGAMVPEMRRRGIPLIEEADLERYEGRFDLITMIEVIEHVPDPLAELRKVRKLLKRGGVLFLTTGNAKPHRSDLLNWPYIIPEIHVSCFEPETMANALGRTGFLPEAQPDEEAFREIIRFKGLKNLGFRQVPAWDKFVPWRVFSRLADWRYGLTSHPYGIAA